MDEPSIPKYPKLRYPGDESVFWSELFAEDTDVVVMEKLDGANSRFRWTGDEWLFGSRNVLFHEDGDPLSLEECNEQFRHAIEYVRTLANTDVDYDLARYSFYGEAMHTHSIDYDAWDGRHPDIDGSIPNVIVFDVYDHDEGAFVDRDALVELTLDQGFRTPSYWTGSAAGIESRVQDDPEELIPESEFRDPDPEADTEFDQRGLAEGVVLRNVQTGEKAKLVHQSFKETNAMAFESPSQAQTEAGRFVATYVTDARIEKQVHKLIDEGDYDGVAMDMMSELPRRVLTDVMAEEGWELLTNDVELTEDVKGEIRSKSSKQCVRTLKELLQTGGIRS